MSRSRSGQSNPQRTAASQARRRSGAAGPHKQASDRPRAEIEREAVEDYYDDLQEDMDQ